MRSILLALVLLALSFDVYAERLLIFETKFKGMQVGKSTLNEVVEAFGKPNDQVQIAGNIKLFYRDAIFVINPKTRKINTIIILDPAYVDLNDISLGDSVSLVESLPNLLQKATWAFDRNNGVVYWFDSDAVHKIVYVHKALNR